MPRKRAILIEFVRNSAYVLASQGLDQQKLTPAPTDSMGQYVRSGVASVTRIEARLSQDQDLYLEGEVGRAFGLLQVSIPPSDNAYIIL